MLELLAQTQVPGVVPMMAFACAAFAIFAWTRFLSLHDTARKQAPKLTYFDLPDSEKVRLTLAVADVPFVDERIPLTEQSSEVSRRLHGGLIPFGQLPVATIDGKTYAQSSALLRYFGRQANLYPDGIDQLTCDMILEALSDIDRKLLPQHHRAVLKRSSGKPLVPLTSPQVQQVEFHLTTDVLPSDLAHMERILVSSHGPWFCGKQLTICDLACSVLIRGLEDGTYVQGIHSSVLDSCPMLIEHARRVAQIPRVRLYYSKHSRAAPDVGHPRKMVPDERVVRD